LRLGAYLSRMPQELADSCIASGRVDMSGLSQRSACQNGSDLRVGVGMVL